MVARGCAGDELPGWFIEDAGSGMLYKRGRLLGEGTFGRCYQLTEVASGRVYAAKVIPRVRLTTVGIGERVSLGDTQKVPREVGVIPTHRDPPQSPALAPSPSFPGRWMGSHPHLPKGACRGSPDPEGSLGAGGCRARADAGGAGAGAARLPAPPAHRPPPRALRRQQPRLPAAGVLQPAGERAPAPQNGASPCQGFARPRSWHLAPSPVPRRHPAGPGEADGAGGAVLPAADHLGAEIPPRTGHRPPGPQAEQLLGDQEDAGEDRGSGAGTAGGTSWTALGGALRNAQLPGPGGVGPQGTRGALGRLGPGLRHVSRDLEGGWGGAPGPTEQPDPPRYTALTGSPPFEAAHRQELYRRIRVARYPLPPHLSPRARALIARLLAPEPAARPSLRDMLDHGFFTQVWGRHGGHGPHGHGGGTGGVIASCSPGLHTGQAAASRLPLGARLRGTGPTVQTAAGGCHGAGEGVAVPGAPGLATLPSRRTAIFPLQRRSFLGRT
ncbi:inactive serine/threonine-protein kinase PLK5 isoform 1-T1 [Morphnus guianensis]